MRTWKRQWRQGIYGPGLREWNEDDGNWWFIGTYRDVQGQIGFRVLGFNSFFCKVWPLLVLKLRG